MARLTLLLFLTLVALSSAQNKYSNYTSLGNPYKFNSVVWGPDWSFVMLYGEEAPVGTAFRAYDWKPITDETLV